MTNSNTCYRLTLSVLSFALLLCAIARVSTAAAQTSGSKLSVEERIGRIESAILPPVMIADTKNLTSTLAERMAALHVPGVSVAVIHNGQIEWARGFGVTKIGGPPVSVNTLFQAGSISKPVAATAILRLVQSGKLNLDMDVNQYLKSWKVPDSTFSEKSKVTLRELLTHTAGITVHGFPGYTTGQPVPSLVQVLNGQEPANTPAIRVDTTPGTIWRYSGGGYTIAQQLLVDVTGTPFPKFMHDTVLAPLGMTHSTYEQPLPKNRLPDAATPYRADGQPVEGGPHTYPEMAAAGLWTTPSDLARFAIAIQSSLASKSNRVLSAAMVRQMLTPGLGKWGLGLQIGGTSTNPHFNHGGADEGFISNLVAYNEGDGVVIMTNSDSGGQLADELLRTIAHEYGWPDFAPPQRSIVPLSDADFDKFTGYYQPPNAPSGAMVYFHIYREDTHFYSQITGQRSVEIFAASPSEFFASSVAAEISFDASPDSAVDGLVLHQNGRQTPWHRVPTEAAETAIAKLQRRIKDGVPSPGTDASLRRFITSWEEKGRPNYDDMEPGLAEAARKQAPQTAQIIQQLGAFESLTFVRVNPIGMDIYQGTFAHGEAEFTIAPLDSNGKVVERRWRVLP